MTVFELMKSYTSLEIYNLLPVGTKLIGTTQITVNGLASISNATNRCISFVDPHAFRMLADMVNALKASKAGIVIVPFNLQIHPSQNQQFIAVDNPRKRFISLINDICIKSRDYIHIGRQCTISEQAIIGDIGFGYVLYDMNMEPFPQIGYVHIGNHVRIQAFTAINRGSLGTTRIGDYTIINKFVNIGHNDHIGRHCIIQPHTCLNGSITVGDHTWIGSGVTIRDHVTIGKNCIIGAGSNVISNIPDGRTVKGNPAK